MWITFAVRTRFALSARLPETVNPFTTPVFFAKAGYAQNMWISLWETASDPRGDAFWSALLAISARRVQRLITT